MQTHVTNSAEKPHAAHTTEHRHPNPTQYVQVAVVLAIITGAEVAVYYQPSLKGVLVPILFALSAFKFSLVVMFFMHLRYDSRLFSMVFSGPLLLAFAVMIALLAMFHRALLGV